MGSSLSQDLVSAFGQQRAVRSPGDLSKTQSWWYSRWLWECYSTYLYCPVYRLIYLPIRPPTLIPLLLLSFPLRHFFNHPARNVSIGFSRPTHLFGAKEVCLYPWLVYPMHGLVLPVTRQVTHLYYAKPPRPTSAYLYTSTCCCVSFVLFCFYLKRFCDEALEK